ncbi:MAG: hypothetical protein Kilf2KO_26760 [Rhodospirillales bacterium]
MRKALHALAILAPLLALPLAAKAPLAQGAVDLTGPVLLLSDAPRMLADACPKLAGEGADCRIEQVSAQPSAQGWLAVAQVRIYRPDGRQEPLTLRARLEPSQCKLVDRQVTPDSPPARRLLTMTERQIARGRSSPQNMQTFCLMARGLLSDLNPPACLCP